ncbi:MAG TPA: hypothetical protein VGL18_13420 [Actinomycetota bacterium]
MSIKRKWLIGAAVGVAVLGIVTATALGSPGGGFEQTILGHRATLANAIHSNFDGIKLKTKAPVDEQMITITYHPGGFSGWHYHPGFVMVIVESGHITAHFSDCSTKTYGPHEAFFESGHEPFMVSNDSATEDAVVYAAFMAPQGSPFRVETDVPGCAG